MNVPPSKENITHLTRRKTYMYIGKQFSKSFVARNTIVIDIVQTVYIM